MRFCLVLAAAAFLVNAQSRTEDEYWSPYRLRSFDNNASSVDVAFGGLGGRSSLLELAARQQRVCPPGLPRMCPGGYCCYANSNCFPQIALGCCPFVAQTCGGKYCCVEGASCCPGGGCCNPGEGCCGAPGNCCNSGTTCCVQAEGCCKGGAICCPGACCAPGSQCGGNGKCISPSQSQPSQTQSQTQTQSQPSQSMTCSTIVPRALETGLGKRSVAPFSLYFPNSPEIQDLLSNMCIGMRKRGAVQSEELTYLGPKSTHGTEKEQNRKDAGCVGASNDCDFNGGLGDSCDEYPFAGTQEGGIDQGRCTRAHKRCIPHVQNSKQGRIFSKYLTALRRNGTPLKPGDKFTVQIDPSFDCRNVPDDFKLSRMAKRNNAPLARTGEESTVWRPIGNSSDTNYLLVGLGDIADGTYKVDLSVKSGSITSLTVMDNEGDEYTSHDALLPGASANMEFMMQTVAGLGGVALAVVMETDSDEASVSYSYKGEPFGSSIGGNEGTKLAPKMFFASLGVGFWLLQLA